MPPGGDPTPSARDLAAGALRGSCTSTTPAPDKWTKKKDMPVNVHHQAQAAVQRQAVHLRRLPARDQRRGGTTNVWEFDPVADSYKALAPMPVKRCSAIAETVNGKIYVIGGLEPLENGKGTRVTGRNEMYDPATNTWTEREPDADVARSRVLRRRSTTRSTSSADASAPATSPRPRNIDIVEEYDPATNLWGAVKDRMPTARSGGGAATYNGKIYVGGGELQTRQLAAAFKALEAYDPVSNTWEILPSMPSSRHGNAMGFIGNKLHVVSGKQEGGGAADMTGNSPHPYATEAHDVLEIPSGTQ